ncbi:PadR family transcriptional regulator [Paenibacillus agricola]|uniref:PadR family transcriptional regulator n=1 Tax=Paenibacillus agricola TaxID=2716264 RepID=A0ABX0J4V6_9BACL|nr:PadR family transcriptional regulator [Paenibacillus agricola]NHN29064.1 PadR family transcriptional regulator [Paenibacillus agricola]
MNTIQYALLSLLAREPLSGYDMKQQINLKINPFWKISNNQLYPVLGKLEKACFIQLKAIEQDGYRPARKIYEITDAGLEKLKEWIAAPSETDVIRDEFTVKLFNSWLLEPEKMINILADRKRQHEEKLLLYANKMKELAVRPEYGDIETPLFSTAAILNLRMGYERSYMEWCDNMGMLLQGSLDQKSKTAKL